MSELKEVKLYEMNLIKFGLRNDKLYFKAEADKVIAEKDKEIEELQKQVHDYAQGLYVIQAKAEKEARHDKHKRCLAMASFCFTKGKEKQSVHKLKTFFWSKWGNRWWKLAEKFKEAN